MQSLSCWNWFYFGSFLLSRAMQNFPFKWRKMHLSDIKYNGDIRFRLNCCLVSPLDYCQKYFLKMPECSVIPWNQRRQSENKLEILPQCFPGWGTEAWASGWKRQRSYGARSWILGTSSAVSCSNWRSSGVFDRRGRDKKSPQILYRAFSRSRIPVWGRRQQTRGSLCQIKKIQKIFHNHRPERKSLYDDISANQASGVMQPQNVRTNTQTDRQTDKQTDIINVKIEPKSVSNSSRIHWIQQSCNSS